MLRGRLSWTWAVLLGSLLFAEPARAQPRAVNLRHVWVSPDPEATLSLEPARTPGHLEWNLGVWASYANRSIEVSDPVRGTLGVPIQHRLAFDTVLGIGLIDRLFVGAVLPLVAYQVGDSVQRIVPSWEDPATTALGDLALVTKASLVPGGALGGFGLAALGRVTLPTGDGTSLASEAAVTADFRLLGELRMVALEFRAAAGARIRGARPELASVKFGNELPWAAGITLLPQLLGLDAGGNLRFSLESRGAIALTPSFGAWQQSPAFLDIVSRYQFSDFALTTGVEFGLTDAIGSPLARVVVGLGFAPRFPDVDEDGILDEDDECAELPEDRDGFEDHDGCPDFDNDGDGVPDDVDECPNVAEDLDEHEDEDGCPDPDNDGDGIPDTEDRCPNEPGAAGTPGAEAGCPAKDRDGDGIPDAKDRCPAEPEDRDGFEDDDGCPDTDHDRDGVPEGEDACPEEPGPERADPTLTGCPSPDEDNDTYVGDADQCPKEPEDFDGVADDDGCPDPDKRGARPLARLDESRGTRELVLARPIPFVGNEVDPRAEPVIRAIAALLAADPELVILVGVRPPGGGAAAEPSALTRSFSGGSALRRYAYRDDAAETIAWSAVRKVPGAVQHGIGFLVLGPETKESAPAPRE